MKIDKKINNIRVDVMLPKQSREDNILAFGELHICDEGGEVVFKVKGLTIKEKDFEGEKRVGVDFPAFKAGRRYRKSFIIEDKTLWRKVCELMMDTYEKEVGEWEIGSKIEESGGQMLSTVEVEKINDEVDDELK